MVAVALGALAMAFWPRLQTSLTARGQLGLGLLLIAVLLLALRQPALAAPVGAIGITLLRGAIAQARTIPGASGRSEVRSDALAMWLDRDSGEMGGEVLTGRFAGRDLSELDAAALQDLAAELANDPDSLGLLLAYLERQRGAGTERRDAHGQPPDPAREMSEAEALRVLGLPQGASRDAVRAAHRRLMMRVHPDLGGSDALAALINAAKARLDP